MEVGAGSVAPLLVRGYIAILSVGLLSQGAIGVAGASMGYP